MGEKEGVNNGRKEREVYDWERRRGWIMGGRREKFMIGREGEGGLRE